MDPLSTSSYEPVAAPPLPSRAGKFTTVFLASSLMFAGVGGSCSISQIGETASFGNVRVLPHSDTEPEQSEPEFLQALHKEYLESARTELRLSMTELAQVFGVSRTALYSWFNGTTPHAKQVERIREVAVIAQEVRERKIPRIDLFMRVPLSHGQTLLQALCANSNVSGAVAEIAELATRRTKAMQTRQVSTLKKPKLSDVDAITATFSTFE